MFQHICNQVPGGRFGNDHLCLVIDHDSRVYQRLFCYANEVYDPMGGRKHLDGLLSLGISDPALADHFYNGAARP